jgi:Rrf2 family iron-sulfur cluster assembly transcriptional regulator
MSDLYFMFIFENTTRKKMIFSKACEYGVRATIYIAQQTQDGKRSNLKDISKEIDSPEAFTAKILQKLSKAKIIKSVKGALGGFIIEEKKINKIKLTDIVVAIDGKLYEKKCVLGLKKCSEEQPCPVHNKFKHIKKDLLKMVKKTSLTQMANSVEDGLSCLKVN